MLYRDSQTLKLAAEINDFVRSRTTDPTVAVVALEVAMASCSFVPFCETIEPLPSKE